MSQLTVLITSPRVPAGLLSRDAWRLLETAAVFSAPGAGLLDALQAADIEVGLLDPTDPDAVSTLLAAAGSDLGAVWVATPGGDEQLLRRVGERLTAAASGADSVDLQVLPGSWDPPGARLLDVVAVMDRLRSPGGCPWDAEQTHESLAPYLIEEAFEALDAVETGDDDALREELGDVLLQVAFHSRLAQERPDGWTIDDVAAGIVDKLVRRHPHVFSDAVAEDAAAVNANWEQIKSAERAGKSPLASVPMGQPALRLAATLQRKAARLPVADGVPRVADGSVAAIANAEDAAELLWAVVARCRELDIDPEVALRALSREVRDRLEAGTVTAGLPDQG